MEILRVAMWSGPRNISTALMRAWENRADTTVIDEPFYAFYLQATGKQHPLAAEIIATGETDWRKVAARLTSAGEDGSRIIYQKQMTHHLLPEVERSWLSNLTNCFLIRDPAEVIASYLKKNGEPTLEDLGFIQQAALFDRVRMESQAIPPIVDARDVLENPERTLRRLCGAVGVSFDPAMLSWPPGLRASDGIWAKHWYGEVARSTSFQTPAPKTPAVPPRLRKIHQRCQECYE
ncbi:MAG: hypothetical protein ACREP1_00510, partial [Rhodanobacteraceae bacterium]